MKKPTAAALAAAPVSNDYPKMVYRYPATQADAERLQDGVYDTEIADDADEHAAMLADGWHETPGAAREASGEPVKKSKK